jgi:DNA-binding MarR family transcriptional regulator
LGFIGLRFGFIAYLKNNISADKIKQLKVLAGAMKKSDIYTRFLNLSRALELSGHARLDANLKNLFSYVHLRIEAGEPTRVSELIQIKSLGSPATIHARIQRLIDLGYFQLEIDNADARIKHVKIGMTGERYVCQMSETLSSLICVHQNS